MSTKESAAQPSSASAKRPAPAAAPISSLAQPELQLALEQPAANPGALLKLQRMAGNRAVSRLTASAPLLQRQMQVSQLPRPVVQRMKIKGIERTFHINEYHFISLMHTVKNIGKSTSTHAILLDDFTDFDGLAAAAEASDISGFKFGGYAWQVKGDEIFPTDGPNIVNLGLEAIEALRAFAAQDVEPPQKLKGPDFNRALTALTRITKQRAAGEKEVESEVGAASPSLSKGKSPLKKEKGRKTEKKEKGEKEEKKKRDEWELPPARPRGAPISADTAMALEVDVDELPSGVRYEPGKPGSAFLMGPGGSKEEYPHLHVFFEPPVAPAPARGKSSKSKSSAPAPAEKAPPPRRFTITSAHATLRPTEQTIMKAKKAAAEGKTVDPRRHWGVNSELQVIPIDGEGQADDDPQVIGTLEMVLAKIRQGPDAAGEKEEKSGGSDSEDDVEDERLTALIKKLSIALEQKESVIKSRLMAAFGTDLEDALDYKLPDLVAILAGD